MANSMRVLGALCVAAALVLSTGGVAYRIKAEPEASRVTPVEQAAATDGDPRIAKTEQAPDPGTCPAPEGASSKPVVVQLKGAPPSKDFVPLNTSGYNYADPRHVPAVVPDPPPTEAEAADPARLDDSVPAAPQDGE